MISSPSLGQPIFAEIDSKGNLIRADDAILNLHMLAGGEKGGVLAIPALAKIAAITHSLQMRVARSVRVAGDDEDIELWVESQLNENIVQLKITGWQIITMPPVKSVVSTSDNNIVRLVIDRNMRLLSADGLPDTVLGNDVIGQAVSMLFPQNAFGNEQLLGVMQRCANFTCAIVSLVNCEGTYSLTAHSERGKNGEFAGYFAELRPNVDPSMLSYAATEPTATLFGQQLGSALRQPLSRIIANAETIGNKIQGPIRENYATYAKDIADAARHLVALVDDLGDLEAMERADFTTAKDNIELGDIARRVAGLLALKAADYNIQIITPDENTQVTAIAEFRRVLQIVINLVTNALRYSPRGSQVTISITQHPDFSTIQVKDQGAGISREDHGKVFEKFERLGRSGDGGSGLGLYISRQLARIMGGDLTVATQNEGGANFILRLPVYNTTSSLA